MEVGVHQRVPRGWGSPAAGRRLPRLLIEDDDPVAAVSDFTVFRDAGFDVAFCSGPGADPKKCPLRRGEPCSLVAGSDVVLHVLPPTLGIAPEIRRRHPFIPVVTAAPRGHGDSAGATGGLAGGGGAGDISLAGTDLPVSASLEAQVRALREALARANIRSGR